MSHRSDPPTSVLYVRIVVTLGAKRARYLTRRLTPLTASNTAVHAALLGLYAAFSRLHLVPHPWTRAFRCLLPEKYKTSQISRPAQRLTLLLLHPQSFFYHTSHKSDQRLRRPSRCCKLPLFESSPTNRQNFVSRHKQHLPHSIFLPFSSPFG